MIDWITYAVILGAILVIAASISWTVRQFLVRLVIICIVVALVYVVGVAGMIWLGAYLKQ